MTTVKPGSVTRISVTEDDIAQGKRGSCEACPIALAAGRAVPGAEASVGGSHLDIYLAGRILTAPLPEAAATFVRRFDDSAIPVGPLEFEITWEDA